MCADAHIVMTRTFHISKANASCIVRTFVLGLLMKRGARIMEISMTYRAWHGTYTYYLLMYVVMLMLCLHDVTFCLFQLCAAAGGIYAGDLDGQLPDSASGTGRNMSLFRAVLATS